MYADMAKTAREEGFTEIASQMEGVAAIEKFHEERYRRFRKDIIENKVFEKEEKVMWMCSNCGHQHYGTEAPQICPVCKHDRGYFYCEKH